VRDSVTDRTAGVPYPVFDLIPELSCSVRPRGTGIEEVGSGGTRVHVVAAGCARYPQLPRTGVEDQVEELRGSTDKDVAVVCMEGGIGGERGKDSTAEGLSGLLVIIHIYTWARFSHSICCALMSTVSSVPFGHGPPSMHSIPRGRLCKGILIRLGGVGYGILCTCMCGTHEVLMGGKAGWLGGWGVACLGWLCIGIDDVAHDDERNQ